MVNTTNRVFNNKELLINNLMAQKNSHGYHFANKIVKLRVRLDKLLNSTLFYRANNNNKTQITLQKQIKNYNSCLAAFFSHFFDI